MTNFVTIPFEVDGINFISRYNLFSPMGVQIASIPQEMFIAMNRECLRSIIGDISKLSREQLLSELERVNENGTEAFIELGENN